MPHRIMNLWTAVLGIAGLLLVAIIVIFGADLIRASRTGPRWKRALVGASLSLLAILGFTFTGTRAAEPVAVVQSADRSETSAVMAIFDLEAQLKQLGELTSARDFDAAAAGELLKNVNANVAILSNGAKTAKLTPKGLARAKFLLAEAARQTAITQALIPIGTTNLARSAQWKTVSDAWSYVTPLADSYKSTTGQRKLAAAKFKDAAKAISELSAAGLLSGPEAAMLTIDMGRLKSDLATHPPTDAKFTCYDYGVMPAARLSMTNLSKRVKLLQQALASNRIAPAAMDRIVERVQRELDQLADPKLSKSLGTDADRINAKKLHAEVSELIVQVKFTVLRLRLDRTSGWKDVETALASAAPLAKSHRSTSAQRVAVTKQIKTANAQLATLAQAGLITASEAELMLGELARLKSQVYLTPPTDSRVSCYEMMAPDPIGDSTKRLTKRIGLLGKLVDSGKLNPLVAGKILPSISADIKTLQNARKGEALRKQAVALLTRIDKKFANGPK